MDEDRVVDKVAFLEAKVGVQAASSSDEENALLNYIDYMSQSEFPLSIHKLLGFAWCIAKERGAGL